MERMISIPGSDSGQAYAEAERIASAMPTRASQPDEFPQFDKSRAHRSGAGLPVIIPSSALMSRSSACP